MTTSALVGTTWALPGQAVLVVNPAHRRGRVTAAAAALAAPVFVVGFVAIARVVDVTLSIARSRRELWLIAMPLLLCDLAVAVAGLVTVLRARESAT